MIGKISPDDKRLILDPAKGFDRLLIRKPVKKKRRVVQTTSSHEFDRVKQTLEKAKELGIDVAHSYDDWVRLGLIFARHFGEQGRELFASVCHTREDEAKYDTLMAVIERDYPNPIGIGSFYFSMIQKGVEISFGNDKIDKCRGFLLRKGVMYNSITAKLEIRHGTPFTDRIYNSLYLEAKKEFGVSREIFDAALNSEFIPEYNPIQDKFEALRCHYFESSPLEDFLRHIKVRSWYVKGNQVDPIPYIKKWLLSIVAAAYGQVSEIVLVLISQEHGTGKTMFFSRLLPEDLRDYFTIDKLDQGKDSDLLMTQKLIILDDEYAGKSKKDAAHLKAKISQEVFSHRKAYGRVTEDFRRLAVLCGATNSPHILNDSSGNRRLLPVQVISRNYALADSIDRDDLWADIVQQYFAAHDKGDTSPYKLTADDYKIVQEASEDSQFVNDHKELILQWLYPGTEHDEFLSATEIVAYLHEKTFHSFRLSAVKMGQELTMLGFPYKVTKTKRGYHVCKGNKDKIEEAVAGLSCGGRTAADEDDELPF